MADHKWECGNCRLVIVTSSGITPSKQHGSHCPRDSQGLHTWYKVK